MSRIRPQVILMMLRCTKGSKEVYVEVKGTQSRGTKVFLTRGEVRVAPQPRPTGDALLRIYFTRLRQNAIGIHESPYPRGDEKRDGDGELNDATHLGPR